MIDGHRVLAVIPARGGSKGVPRKNIRIVAGRSLLSYSVSAALESNYIDTVIVSSEDDEICEIAKQAGATILKRPDNLATDTTSGVDVLLHAIDNYKDFDYVVLLQPTSPLRTSDDIDNALRLCLDTESPFCVSVCVSEKSPYWMYTRGDNGKLCPMFEGVLPTRRQDSPEALILNGAVYVASLPWLSTGRELDYKQAVAYVMPEDRSVDIDTENDIRYMNFLLSQ